MDKKRIYIKLMLLMATVFNFLCCERRPLEEEVRIPEGAKVAITIDWAQSGIIPQNATLLVYKEDGSLFLETFFENTGVSVYTEVYLPAGTYTLIGFNEKRDQIDYVRIRGYENLSTLEAYVTTASTTYNTQSKASGETLVDQPGPIAVAKKKITVKEEDVESFRKNALQEKEYGSEKSSLQVKLQPVLKTSKVNITVHVKGLNNARMPALAELRHMAGGYLIGTDKNTLIPVTTQFMLNNRTYKSGSKTEGTISASITSFGIRGNRRTIDSSTGKIYLDLAFQLVDKERTVVHFSLDVTSALKIEIDKNEIEIIDLDINQLLFNEIDLPDVIPERGNNGNESGIVSELIDWETVVVPIPL